MIINIPNKNNNLDIKISRMYDFDLPKFYYCFKKIKRLKIFLNKSFHLKMVKIIKYKFL